MPYTTQQLTETPYFTHLLRHRIAFSAHLGLEGVKCLTWLQRHLIVTTVSTGMRDCNALLSACI